MEGKVELSVVVPVFNEAENLPEVYERLTRALDGLQHGPLDEVIFVDDGSNDGSDKILRQLHERDPRVKVIRFSQNFGQHAALSAGIERARGRIVVIMDGDLQYDPQDIHKLLEKMEEGHDVVTGWREGREDGLLTRRLPSYLANRLIGAVTGIHLHDYNCGLKAFTADVAKRLSQYGEMRRFLGALLALVGRSIAEVKVSHYPRAAGASKYGFLDLISHLLDFLVSFPARPFQWIGLFGLGCTALGLLGGVLYFPLRFLFGVPLGVRTQFLIILAIFLGLQFSILGLLGEFTARIFRLIERRPFFVIEEVLE